MERSLVGSFFRQKTTRNLFQTQNEFKRYLIAVIGMLTNFLVLSPFMSLHAPKQAAFCHFESNVNNLSPFQTPIMRAAAASLVSAELWVTDC